MRKYGINDAILAVELAIIEDKLRNGNYDAKSAIEKLYIYMRERIKVLKKLNIRKDNRSLFECTLNLLDSVLKKYGELSENVIHYKKIVEEEYSKFKTKLNSPSQSIF